MGKQLRGKRNGSYRPDLVICDDLESAKNTNTPELRDKNLHWFNSVVIPIGEPEKTAFIYMGTIVHGSGLLVSILNRADFESRVYSAIVNPPDREDLWQEFETVYRERRARNGWRMPRHFTGPIRKKWIMVWRCFGRLAFLTPS